MTSVTATRLLLLTGLLLPLTAAAGIYKWTDADGNVHYGEKPPAGEQAESMTGRGAGNGSGAEESRQQYRESIREFNEARQEQKENAAKDAQKQAARQRQCEAARAALERLETQSRLQYINEEGERAYLTEEQRQERMRQARDLKEKTCQ